MDGKMSNDSSSKLSLAAKITVSNAKSKLEKFDGTNNFGMWQCKVFRLFYFSKSWILL